MKLKIITFEPKSYTIECIHFEFTSGYFGGRLRCVTLDNKVITISKISTIKTIME